MNAKRVLVTGGAGFLGSHLCDRLVSDDNLVICADNLLTGDLQNIAHLLDHDRFTFLDHDITEPLRVDVDAIFNLACPASPVRYMAHPVETIRACVVGLQNMLDLAEELDVPILQASTSEVYGDPREHPQTESYWGHVNPTGPRSCYDEGKRCAESLCSIARERRPRDVRISRIFNTYGPRMHRSDGRVISTFINQALSGVELTIYGDGCQTRSFCYVDDMVEALILMMSPSMHITGPMNLGNPAEITVQNLAETVLRLTGSPSEIVYKPPQQDDPQRRKPDISLARRVLGWRPSIALEEGIDKTILYYKAHRLESDSVFV